jgi:hypothetical protein
MTEAPIAIIDPRVETSECEAQGCDKIEGLAEVAPQGEIEETQILCGPCRVEYFEELIA